MSPELIKQWAKEAGFRVGFYDAPAGPIPIVTSIATEFGVELAAFAALVAAHQRELDARICDEKEPPPLFNSMEVVVWTTAAYNCAAAIRGTK